MKEVTSMNNNLYYIVDETGKIVHSAIDMILCLHEFIQNQQFNNLQIISNQEPTKLKIPSNGATQTGSPPLVEMNGFQLQTITLNNSKKYNLIIIPLEEGQNGIPI